MAEDSEAHDVRAVILNLEKAPVGHATLADLYPEQGARWRDD